MSPDRNKRFLVASNEALTAAAIVLLLGAIFLPDRIDRSGPGIDYSATATIKSGSGSRR
ncbi:MAG: hypothetical protein U1E28_21165 [Beijerinckiaceae bacterium]